MPGSPKNTEFVSGKRDTATNFNAEYAKKGIQPTSANGPSYRQPKPDQNIRAVKTTHYQNPRIVSRKNYSKINLPGGGNSLAKAAFTRGRATAVSSSIMAGGLFAWSVFQLPLAIFSILLLGVAGAVAEIKSVLMSHNPEDGFWVSIGKSTLSIIGDIVSDTAAFALDLFGIDINTLSPENIFMLTHVLVFMFGVAMLLIVYSAYTLTLHKPLGGNGSGMKYGALLGCLIGYSIPIINLFPWFIVWVVVVWIYPK